MAHWHGRRQPRTPRRRLQRPERRDTPAWLPPHRSVVADSILLRRAGSGCQHPCNRSALLPGQLPYLILGARRAVLFGDGTGLRHRLGGASMTALAIMVISSRLHFYHVVPSAASTAPPARYR